MPRYRPLPLGLLTTCWPYKLASLLLQYALGSSFKSNLKTKNKQNINTVIGYNPVIY